MKKSIFSIMLFVIFFLPSYSQAGLKDVKARAKMKIKWPGATHWKCRKIVSFSSEDFLKAGSLYFRGKSWRRSFGPSLVKKMIPKNTNIIFAELIADHGNFYKTSIVGPTEPIGYDAHYNIFIVSGKIPKTDYFWTRDSRMNYGNGLGYITFKGEKPLFVDAKKLYPNVIGYAGVREKTLKDLKDCKFWIRILPLKWNIYEADPPSSAERKVKVRKHRDYYEDKRTEEQIRKDTNSQSVNQREDEGSPQLSFKSVTIKGDHCPYLLTVIVQNTGNREGFASVRKRSLLPDGSWSHMTGSEKMVPAHSEWSKTYKCNFLNKGPMKIRVFLCTSSEFSAPVKDSTTVSFYVTGRGIE